MRILIYGAGVIGTFYGVKLSAAGHDVTLLARGRRAEQVRKDGLVVDERGYGTVHRLRVVEVLPEWMLVGVFSVAMRTSYAELIVARHATAAREEMAMLAAQLRVLVARGVSTSGDL